MIFAENFSTKQITQIEKKWKKILYENSIDWKEWLSKKKEENANYCVICGKKLKRGQEKFCSRSCSAKHNNGLRKEDTYCHAMTENFMNLNKGKSTRINRYKNKNGGVGEWLKPALC